MTEIDLTPITRLEYDIDAILNDHAVAEPITRIELILADIVAGNTTTVEPVTRIETYLAIISGADYPVPEPVTRIETFLAIIAGEDYEEPEAVTRLEGLLAEWVEKGSGIWKTVTGTLIHITDALASPVQALSVAIDSETGATGCELVRTDANLWGGEKIYEDFYRRYSNVSIDRINKVCSFPYNTSQEVLENIPYNFRFKEKTRYTFVITLRNKTTARANLRLYYVGGTYTTFPDLSASDTKQTVVVTSQANKTVSSLAAIRQGGTTEIYYDESGIFEGVITASKFTPYVGTTYPISWQTEAGSITSGTLTIDENGGVTLESGGNTYNLTGVTPITLLAGENNVWADCGDTTLTYQAVSETAFSDNADTGMADYMTLTE